MTTRRGFILCTSIIIAACGGGAPAAVPETTMRAMRATTTAEIASACKPSPSTSASLEVVVLGSGGPVPAGRACASHVVIVDGVPRVLVDAGPGAAIRLGEAGIDTRALDTILLTHLHIDHAGDLPGVVKARDLSHEGPLSFFIVGPEGRGEYPATSALVELLFGARGAYSYLQGFKNPFNLKTQDLPTIAADTDVRVVRRDKNDGDDLEITAISTEHGAAPAIAYRINHKGRSIVFGGDTTLAGNGVSKLAAGADLFVANATVLDEGAPKQLYSLHAPPRRIAEVARDARVHAILLAHLGAAVIEREKEVIASMHAVAASADVRLARDCLRVPVLPDAANDTHDAKHRW